jgi:hypothetical protein
MKYSPRRFGGWFEGTCLNTAVYEVAGPLPLNAEYAPFTARPYEKNKANFNAGSVTHTSTNFFVLWKSSAGIFPRTFIHHPMTAGCQVARW